MKTIVNKIIPFSSVDGPGNRTAIFLQGCNINCKYCHNPETRGMCVNCGACAVTCPAGALSYENGQIRFDPSRCTSCDTCIHTCPHDSSPRTCEMTPEEVFARVKKQIFFIRGITVSGGECMLQPEFIRQLFVLARKANLTTLIDSNGTIPFSRYPELLEVTSGVMLDIKAFKDEDHIAITDCTNRIVLENAVYLSERDKLYEVRCVLAPDLYDTTESVMEMGEYLLPYYRKHPFRIKLIAYRPMGVRKEYAQMAVPSTDYLEMLKERLREMGYSDIILI